MDNPDPNDYVVLFINCLTGQFRAFGLFGDQEECEGFISEQDEPSSFSWFVLEQKS